MVTPRLTKTNPVVSLARYRVAKQFYSIPLWNSVRMNSNGETKWIDVRGYHGIQGDQRRARRSFQRTKHSLRPRIICQHKILSCCSKTTRCGFRQTFAMTTAAQIMLESPNSVEDKPAAWPKTRKELALRPGRLRIYSHNKTYRGYSAILRPNRQWLGA